MWLCTWPLINLLAVYLLCVLDAQPTEGEREVWNQVNSVLQDSENILQGLQAYKGAGQEIRDVREDPHMASHLLTTSQTHLELNVDH